jgi:hypothetical protein
LKRGVAEGEAVKPLLVIALSAIAALAQILLLAFLFAPPAHADEMLVSNIAERRLSRGRLAKMDSSRSAACH